MQLVVAMLADGDVPVGVQYVFQCTKAGVYRWPHLFTYYIVGQNVLRNQVVFYHGIGRIISGHIADRAGNYNISVATPTAHTDRQFLFYY